VQSSKTETNPSDRLVALSLGLLLLAIYLTTSALRFQSIDEVAIFSVARSLAGRGTFDADVIFWTQANLGVGSVTAPGLDGHAYSVKDIMPSLLATPLVWLASLVGASPVRSAFLLSPLVTALTGGLLYLAIRSHGYSLRTALLGGLTFGLAGLAWPYAETLFTQPLAALGLLIALLGAEQARRHNDWRAALLGGLGLGLAGASATPTWITAPVYLIYLLPLGVEEKVSWQAMLKRAVRLLVAFGAGAALFAAGIGTYNLIRFGSPLWTGHHETGAVGRLSWRYLPTSILGQLFSTPRGLLWYAPFVILVPAGIATGWRTNRHFLLLCLGQVSLLFLLYSFYAEWWAGQAWGPRFLVAVMPALTLLTIPALDMASQSKPTWRLAVVIGVLTISAITQALASTLDVFFTEGPVFQTLNAVSQSPPEGLFVQTPVLIDPSLLPWVRIVGLARQGRWDMLWLSSGHPDWPILAGQMILIALGVIMLIWVARGKRYHRVIAPAAQVVASIALATFMVLRYPYALNDYAPTPTAELEGFSGLVAATSDHTRVGDGIVVVLPYSYLSWIDRYHGATPDVGLTFEDPLSPQTINTLERASQQHRRLWLVTEGTSAGNPANGVEHWLAEHSFVGAEMWFGGYRLVPYSFPPDIQPPHSIGQVFGNREIRLAGLSYQLTEQAGERWLNVWLQWEAVAPSGLDYKVFIHLLDANGMIVAQHDGVPVGSYAPTRIWTAGTVIDDRYYVTLPLLLPAGEYRLSVGLYDPLSGNRLPLASGTGDAVQVVMELGE
jgi:hypothetical protein